MRERRHELTTTDGARLDVLELTPGSDAPAIVIAGHAMMVDRRTFYRPDRPDRPSLAGTLVTAGLRVLIPDLRGHGASGPLAGEGADWSYDDLVRDVGAYVALARALAPDRPVVLLGHSLFGHLSLAWLGLQPDAPVAAVVLLGVNIWNRRWEPNVLHAWAQRGTMALAQLVTSLRGHAPVRALRLGTADEARRYWSEMARWVARDTWSARDGADYHRNLARIRRPVLHVVSDGDTFAARPAQALRFSAPLAGVREVVHLGRGCPHPALAGLAPGHMGFVTDPACEPLWAHVAEWIRARV